MDVERVRLLGARVLIRPDPEEKKIGSIFIPDSARKPSGTGTVVAMGPGMLCKDGTRWPMPIGVGVGTKIIYGRDAREIQQKVVIDGEVFLKMYDDDILGVVEA